MALVEIAKGNKYLIVPMGAYVKQYAPAGWGLKNDLNSEKQEKKSHSDWSETSDEKSENDTENDAEDDTIEDEEEEPYEDDETPEYLEELEEKPLSELSVPELRSLAAHKGVDVTGLTTAKKLRDAIRKSE